jgi:hypothetical protein
MAVDAGEVELSFGVVALPQAAAASATSVTAQIQDSLALLVISSFRLPGRPV